MVFLAVGFFVILIYVQGKSLRDRQMWGELTVFLFITALAAYYTVGPLMGYHVLNPADVIKSIFQPAVSHIFG